MFGDTNVKSVSALEGDSVTLNTSFTKITGVDRIKWEIENYNNLGASIERGSAGYSNYQMDRTKVDYETGSLTVTNVRTTDSGFYKLYFEEDLKRIFAVTVYGEFNNGFTCLIYYSF